MLLYRTWTEMPHAYRGWNSSSTRLESKASANIWLPRVRDPLRWGIGWSPASATWSTYRMFSVALCFSRLLNCTWCQATLCFGTAKLIGSCNSRLQSCCRWCPSAWCCCLLSKLSKCVEVLMVLSCFCSSSVFRWSASSQSNDKFR